MKKLAFLACCELYFYIQKKRELNSSRYYSFSSSKNANFSNKFREFCHLRKFKTSIRWNGKSRYISQKEKQNRTKKTKKPGSFGNEEKSFYSMVLRVYEYIRILSSLTAAIFFFSNFILSDLFFRNSAKSAYLGFFRSIACPLKNWLRFQVFWICMPRKRMGSCVGKNKYTLWYFLCNKNDYYVRKTWEVFFLKTFLAKMSQGLGKIFRF